MEFFLAGFNLEHCQVFWQLRWVYSQAMKRVYAGCSPRVKSISNDRTVRRHDVGEQSVKPKVLSGVFPVFPKHNHGITEGRDDNPIGPRHHEPWWHPRPNCAFCCTRIVPDKCSEVNIHVKSVLQALHHAQCCVCPDPAVLVEEEHSYHVTLCLNAHLVPRVLCYHAKHVGQVDGTLQIQLFHVECWVGCSVRPEASLLHWRGTFHTLTPQRPDLTGHLWSLWEHLGKNHLIYSVQYRRHWECEMWGPLWLKWIPSLRYKVDVLVCSSIPSPLTKVCNWLHLT